MLFQDPPSPCLLCLYYPHSEVPACMFQLRQASLRTPSPRVPCGSARTPERAAPSPTWVGKIPRAEIHEQATATGCPRSSVRPGDPDRGRSPRVSHLQHSAPTPPPPPKPAPPWRSAAAPQLHSHREAGGRRLEAPGSPVRWGSDSNPLSSGHEP